MSKNIIYILGACILGLMNAELKDMVGDQTRFAIAIGYLIILRLVVEKFGK